MPQIAGILETSIYVEDVARAADFYRSLFGFEVMLQDDRFCAMSVAGKQVLLLFRRGGSTSVMEVPGGLIPPHDGSGQYHFAFSVPAADLQAWEDRITARNVAIESKTWWPLEVIASTSGIRT